jgi:hypothetical protein
MKPVGINVIADFVRKYVRDTGSYGLEGLGVSECYLEWAANNPAPF